MDDSEPRSYHHGSLRESLVEAGLELVRADGPAGLGLRAASRLAGVSHNAAYRHFADLDELIAAVGIRCMRELALRMETRQRAVRKRDPQARAWARLDAIGETYVDFATSETGWFRTAFSAHKTPPTSPRPEAPEASAGDEGRDPYAILNACLDELVAVGAVDPQQRPGLEYAAWSAVHGLATLLTDGPLRELPNSERARALRAVLSVTARGLPRPPV